MKIELDKAAAQKIFHTSLQRLDVVKKRLGRPFTLAEKVLFAHLDDPSGQTFKRGEAILALRPDRVAMQDATAQMALLQFMNAGRKTTAVPSTVHCDHLIRAHQGAGKDLPVARDENREVYDFLKTVCAKYGLGYWEPGAGIIHQVVLENYALPGTMMIGTDSHTPNAGGLGMIAVGVGGADAMDVMAGLPWEVKHPKLIGVKLTGKMSGWTSPKDVILKLCGILTTKGGTNRIIEYFGPGTKEISCTGKGTITNMGAELGATTSIFPFDNRMEKYLQATKRGEFIQLLEKHASLLVADEEVEKDPDAYFDQVIEIDLSQLEPHLVGPHSPDVARPVSDVKKDVQANDFPNTLSAALIGSCTNSSYEDLERAADIARQATAHGLKAKVPLMVTPGSSQIFETIARDGQMKALEEVGASVLANACGPCIGQWKRDDIQIGERNSIITSFNRNFPKRNDGNSETYAFIGSPEIVVAYSFAGDLHWNPLKDSLQDSQGLEFSFSPPQLADELPAKGFVSEQSGYLSPEKGRDGEVIISPDSERLQELTPFEAWSGDDFERLPLLLKAKGKCTTDHISPAGPWLRFRGHLDRISDNMFLGAINAFSEKAGVTLNMETGEKDQPISKVARDYRNRGMQWVVVGDENYGEGSSREHAAMSPRYLGAAAVITRSFARIHETNLKKQGVLPLTFIHCEDYEKVSEKDHVSLKGLSSLSPLGHVTCVFHHEDGTEDEVELAHSLTEEQIEWFKAGSALNYLRAKNR